jgi:transposase-like protein
MLSAYISALGRCASFDKGNTLSCILSSVESMSEKQIDEIIEIFNANSELGLPPEKWSSLKYGFWSQGFEMGRKHHKPEEIVAKLRQVDVLTTQGQTVAEAIRSIGVTEVTYYRWRQEYGGLKGDQVKRLKDLEQENARLRKAVSDLTLEKLILKEAASGNW